MDLSMYDDICDFEIICNVRGMFLIKFQRIFWLGLWLKICVTSWTCYYSCITNFEIFQWVELVGIGHKDMSFPFLQHWDIGYCVNA